MLNIKYYKKLLTIYEKFNKFMDEQLEDFTEDSLPKKLKFIKCPVCKFGELGLWHDANGKYYVCAHCGWDSLGLFKTKDKFCE